MLGMDESELIEAPEVARLLGVAPSTVWRRTQRGELTPASVVGTRRVLYWRPEIERLAAAAKRSKARA